MENSNPSIGEEGSSIVKNLEDSDSDSDADDDDLLSFVAFPKKKETLSTISPTSISTTLQGSEVSASPLTTSHVKVTQDAEDEETRDEKNAEIRVKAAPVPESIKNASQLYWHTFKRKRRTFHEPCRECHPDEALGLNFEKWDPEKKVLINYIECCWFSNRKLVSRSSLTPYHGEKFKKEKGRDEEQDEDKEVTSIPQQWCNKMLTFLETDREKRLHWPRIEILQEKLFLQRVLDRAIEVHDQTRKGVGNVERDVQIPLQEILKPDEVKNQDNNSTISDEDDAESVTTRRKTEQLRRGDVIEYYNPIFVFGNPMGLKSATINAIDPKGDPVLDLSTGDILPTATRVRRVQVMFRNKLRDNRNKAGFIEIEWFKLNKDVKKTSGRDSNMKETAKHLRNMVVRHQEKFKRTIKKSGLGDCTEIMSRFKRQRKS